MNHKCTHPNHVDGESCEDRAVGCHDECVCCMGEAYANRAVLKRFEKALKEIVEFGHGKGHGCGYTCANIAEKALNFS